MRELLALRGEQEALDLKLQNLIETLEALPRHDADGNHAQETAFGALLPHQVRSAYFRSRVQPQLRTCVSFRSLMSIRSARKDLGGINHELLVYDKVAGAVFARSAGIACPLRHGVFSREAIPDLDEIVVKPVKGTKSRGLFIRHDKRIIELKSGAVLDTRAALEERMRAFPAADWLVEEASYSSTDLPKPFKGSLRALDLSNAAFLPIKGNGSSIEAIILIGSNQQSVSNAAIQPYENLAGLISVTMQRAKAVSQTEKHLQEVEALASVNELVSSIADTEGFFHALLTKIQQIIGDYNRSGKIFSDLVGPGRVIVQTEARG